MARRGFGSTALRAALGAVTGVAEGLQQREALRQKQKLDEENAAFSRAGMLKSLGFTPRAVRDTADPAAMNVVSLDTPTLAPRGASQAFASAMQQGLGVDPSQRRLGAMDTQSTANPLTAALGSAESKLKDFERQRSSLRANPNMQMNLPGAGRIGFDPEESEDAKLARELKKYEAQQDIITSRQKAEQDTARLRATELTARARKGDPDAKNELLATNPSVYKELFPTRTPREANVKFDDKTGMMINLDTGKATKVEGYEPVGEKVSKGEIQNGVQAMGVARASSSLNLLETNTKLMDKFEQDVLDGKAEITAAQLEAARFALSGAKGSAVAEERLMKGIPLLMSPNPALLRYVRAAKGISGAVREITPRGGSNLMMQMEQTLAGIGPGGTDPESIKQVQVFRNDILNGVREGVMSMRGDRQTQPDTRSGRPPLSSFQR